MRMPKAYGPGYDGEVHPVSKFFAIIVEDLGDTDGKVFSNSDQFFFSTIVQPPTDCEIRGCVEIPEQQAHKMLVQNSAHEKLS
jgi:hypothetical protein